MKNSMLRVSLLFAALYLGISPSASGASSLIIQDFETPLSGWATQTPTTYSSIALTSDSANINSGSGALAWTYSKTTTDNFNNEVRYTFSAQDWSGFDTLSFYLKGDTAAESGKTIRFKLLTSNGTSISGSNPFGTVNASTGYAQASFSLSSIDSETLKTITGIVFYVSGSQFTQGSSYTFFIDDITVSATAVPEPSTYALLTSIICCLFAAVKRTRSKS